MNLPEPLISSLQNQPGFDEAAFRRVHQSGEQITSIRLNPEKFKDQQSATKFAECVPWSTNGFYLQERPSFTLDPLFHAGAYYVQEASSMFLEEAMRQTVDLSQNVKVLDLCAAPGGKSTLIQSIISPQSLLVSNEVIKTRVNILSENITKWGAANVVVTNNDPRDLQRLPAHFDVVVVDAPCSGSGLFRKDPAAINEWSEDNVALCGQRQQRILADVMPALKEGGILIYSTCSYSKEEDEAIADWLVSDFNMVSVRLNLNEDWGIVETNPGNQKTFGYRFYPHKVKGEGFFLSVFQKTQITKSDAQKSKPKKNTELLSAKEMEVIRPYLKNSADYFFFKQNEDVIALPYGNDLQVLQVNLYLKKAGVKLGSIIRNELIPAHDMAISTIISETVPSVEVDEATALQYLRKSDLSINTSNNGWHLLTHKKLPLGWIKVIGNRINNYYPKDWRILNK